MESTLATAYADLQTTTGVFLGWGGGTANGDPAWSRQQQGVLDEVTKSGIRQVNFPKRLDGEAVAYSWSWLKPVASLALASGAVTIPLPDDFGGLEGELSLVSTSGNEYWQLKQVGIGQVYSQQNQLPTTTGRPLMACVEPLKGTTPTAGQRFQLRTWPIADQAYLLNVQYYLLPDFINGAMPYPYGGAAHGELYREACLMAAEQYLDDMAGVHSMKFEERLAASIDFDRRLKAQSLGYNRDRSDLMEMGRHRWHHGFAPITYNGQEF